MRFYNHTDVQCLYQMYHGNIDDAGLSAVALLNSEKIVILGYECPFRIILILFLI